MLALLIALILLALTAAAIGLYRQHQRGGAPEPIREARPAGCCGQHEVCEKESLLAAVSRDIVYYDDEALDRYKGRSGDDYTAHETEDFMEVFETMLATDIPGWVRSLQLRGIGIPQDLRDDIVMVVGELRDTTLPSPQP